MEHRIERWSRTIVIAFCLMLVSFTIERCSNTLGEDFRVTTYDGFVHKCEQAGGVYVESMCLAKENLIELELDN